MRTPTISILTAALVATSISAQGTIVDVAKSAGSFNTLLTAAKKAGLAETLAGKGPFTVFAPTDDAFAKVPEKTLQGLLANPEKLATVLMYHVVPGRVPAKDVLKADWLDTAQGQALRVKTWDGKAMVDGATITETDVRASNGIIHVIDSVILPRPNIVETAVANGSFTTLVKAVKAAGLVDTLANGGPFTVFAPNDAAFAKLPKETLAAVLADKKKLTEILTYHVVPGRALASDVVGSKWHETVEGGSLMVSTNDAGGAMVDDAKIVATDVIAGNGVIHVIDTVMMPRPDIVGTAVSAGSFKTLVAAVKAAGLVEALQGEGPFTVFAPTDAAFAKLPEGTVEGLLANPDKLAAILKYHVIPGRVLSTDLPAGKLAQPKTLQGTTLAVKASDSGVSVDEAAVVKADILCKNGVIHVIDSVVLPSDSQD